MNHTFRNLSSLLAVLALSSLAACGGGGGGGDAPSQPPTQPTNTATVSVQATSNVAVGDSITVTWNNSNNVACTGNGLLAGISTASGTTQVAVSAEGEQSYSVTCGGTTSNEVAITALPTWTLISDPVFEQLLISAGLDDTLDGRVKTSTILGVTKLAILARDGYTQSADTVMIPTGTAQITNVTGLENFRNLSYLRIEGQAFSTIDVSKLTQLTMLSVWQDPITTLDVTALKQLKILGISETGLTSIDLSQNAELTELDAQNAGTLPYVLPNGADVQGLTSLDVSHNPKLTLLVASYNRLTTLDLTHNKLLQRAALDHNLLTSVDATGVNATIDTSSNPMTP
jgi:predicted small lipoprotein YifL